MNDMFGIDAQHCAKCNSFRVGDGYDPVPGVRRRTGDSGLWNATPLASKAKASVNESVIRAMSTIRFYFARCSLQVLTVMCLLLCISLPGCASFFADRLVKPPNHDVPVSQLSDSSQSWMKFIGVDGQMRLKVGPPDASLFMWIVEPRNEEGAIVASRGTILILHGLNDGAFWMLGKAQHLSRHGYRTVVVSLRGYGRSSGDYRTFGVVEKRDLSQVIDALQEQKLCTDRVGVWGMSYGAATALELAGHDPRIKAVVAVAGFSSMREVVPGTSRLLIPVIGWFTSDAMWHEAIDEAGRRAGFDPDDADAKKAITKTKAAVLLVHGTCDMIVPYANATRLIACADPQRSKLITIPLAGHISIWIDPDGQVAREGLAWFDRWLPAEADDGETGCIE